MTQTIVWSTKTRDLHNHHFDSTIWNDFRFRDDDIVISTYAKSGTTWMQQVVLSLIFEDAEPRPVMEVAPWVDRRFPATNGRWRDVLSADESRKYEEMALRNLGPDCAHWLATGERRDQTIELGLQAAA